MTNPLRFRIRTAVMAVAAFAATFAFARSLVTSFDAGARGWACGGRYTSVNLGNCDVAWFSGTSRGDRVEFLCPWSPPVVLLRW